MPQIINTNIASLNAQRNLDKSQSSNQQALQRLSSGLRINSAKDDAAGLAISTRFTSQIKGLNVAVRNAGDGIALAQTAEGALGSMNDSLQRIRELAVQSANATNSDVDRDALQAEVSQLVAEISRTADETDFNGRNLLDGSFAASFQVGANAGQTIDVSIAELTTDKLGASDQSGISSTGVNEALGNGDLIINGQEISASRASDDTASTADAANSAIAKAATINRESDTTGVKAFVNENTAVGTKQVAAAGTTTLSLNGVSIDLQTSTDAAGSRASVVESINAFAEQTGITAVDSGSDAGGVTLTAADGRNIDISFSTGGGDFATDALASQATGLASSGTKVGGFTLVSNEAIDIDGGDGSAIGDLANAGLTRGTYDKGVAAVTTEKAEFSTTTGNLNGGGSAFNDVKVSATATVGGGAAVTTQAYTYNVNVDGAVTSGQVAAGIQAGDAVATLAKGINDNVTGVEAWEQIDGVLDVSAFAAAEEFTLGNAAGTVNIGTFASTGTTAADAADLVDRINAFDFGTGMEVTATYAGAGTDVTLSIKNFTDDAAEIVPDNANLTFDNAGTGATALTAAATDLTGVVKFKSDTADSVNVTVSRDADDAGGSAVGEDIFLADTDLSESGTAYSGPNGLAEGDLTINGVAIKSATATSDTASATVTSDGSSILSSSKEASAISIAAAINEVSAETGVTATVGETVVVGNEPGAANATTAGFETGDQAGLYINGVSLGDVTLTNEAGSSTIDTDKARTDAINLINSSSGQTGVTAIDNGKSITLEAADGRNISVAIDNKSGNTESGQGIGAVFGLDQDVDGIGESVFGEGTNNPISAESLTYETTTGKIQLSSASEFTVDVGTNGKTELDVLGFQAGTFGGGEDGQFLKDIDITTVEGATEALIAVDNAIGQVASQRADLGAIQNRMESTVSNLQVTSENLNAANSRIQDADFAAETAELQRTNVLQQAGISVLAQANAAGQQVLSLLG